MISPQNLAIGAAAVGMAGKEGDLFRKVLGWSLVLVLLMCVLVYLQSTRGPRLDGRGVSAGAGPAWGEGPPPKDAPDPTAVDLGPLVAEWRRALGDEHVITHEHQLRTYESDGLLQYAVMPGAVVLPGPRPRRCRPWWRACHREGVPVGGARGRVGAVGRGAAGGRRRAHLALAACAASSRWTSTTSAWWSSPA